MPKQSAGLLLFRRAEGDTIEILIAHMGGPFWARKKAASWSIPKGEVDDGEELLATARREFQEELGLTPPDGPTIELGTVRQSGGKQITVFALENDLDLAGFHSNTFEMEWPPRSGKSQSFPEMDSAEWVEIGAAEELLVRGQLPFLEALQKHTSPRIASTASIDHADRGPATGHHGCG